MPPVAVNVNEAIGVPTVPDLLPGLVTVTAPPPPQVGSPDWAGTLTGRSAGYARDFGATAGKADACEADAVVGT